MFDSNVVSGEFLAQAIAFIGVLLTWNFVGRYLGEHQTPRDGDGVGVRFLYRFATVIHVVVLACVIFTLLVFLISGTIDNPTDFRYVTF